MVIEQNDFSIFFLFELKEKDRNEYEREREAMWAK